MIDFFDFCNEMLCLADQNGYLVKLNHAWTKTLGWSAEELSSRPYLDFVHPDDVAATVKEAQLLQSDKYETVQFCNRYRCKDGSYKWLSWQAKPKPNSNEILATARDVTIERLQFHALQQSEERVRRSEQQLIALLNQAPIGIASVDADTGKFLTVNRKYADILGLNQEELSALQVQGFMHSADQTAFVTMLKELLGGQRNEIRMELRLLPQSGSLKWVSLTVVPLWQDDQMPSQYLSMVEDISDKRQAEETLRNRDAQLAGLLEYSSNVIYLKDHRGRYLLTNARFHELFGKNGSEIVGQTDVQLFEEDTAKAFRLADLSVWNDQTAKTFKEVVAHEDGLHTYRSVKFPIKDDKGVMLAVGGISTDITDLTLAYQDLEEKQRLLRNLIDVQEKEKAFICYEFHDGLIQFATGAMMRLESLLDKEIDPRWLKRIEECFNSLKKGVADGRRVIRGVRPTVLDDLGLKAAIEDLIDAIPPAELKISFETSEYYVPLPEELESTVYRVVQEAINNVRKHSGSDQLTIWMRSESAECCLSILDYGRGFDVREARNQGFGLLGMTERIKLAGGSCQITSTKGVGTQIEIRIPIQVEEKTDSE